MRAAIYTRISNDPTGREAGVQRQEADCRTLVEDKGWELVGAWTDNDVSASSRRTRRQGYESLLDAVRGDQVDTLVCWHVDRLYRRPDELETLLDLVEEGRLTGGVRTVTAGDMDLNTASGRFIARQLVGIGKHEVERTQERLRALNRHAAAAGKRVGGRRPFGYETDGSIREGEAADYRWMVRAALDGVSLRAIASRLNDRSVTTAGGSKWSTTRVRDVLRNPRYGGWRTHRGEIVADAEWEPLVDRESWLRLESILSDPARRTSPGPQRRHLLAGLAFCGVCGGRLVARTNHGVPAYGCRSRGDGGCGGVVVTAAPVDEIVRDWVLAAVDNPSVTARLDDAVTDVGDTSLQRSIADCDARLDALVDAYASGRLSTRQYVRASERIESDRERLVAQARSRTPVLGGRTGRGVAEELWTDGELSDRRDLIAALAEKVVIHPAVNPRHDPDGRWVFDPARVEIRAR